MMCHSLNKGDVTRVILLQIEFADGAFFRQGLPSFCSFLFSCKGFKVFSNLKSVYKQNNKFSHFESMFLVLILAYKLSLI